MLRLANGVYLVRMLIIYCTGERLFHVLVYIVSDHGRRLLDGYANAMVYESDFGQQRSQTAFRMFLRCPNDKDATAVDHVQIREVFQVH